MTSIGEMDEDRSRHSTQTDIWVYQPSPYNTPLTIYIVSSVHDIQMTHVHPSFGLVAWNYRDADTEIVQTPSDSFTYILRYLSRR